MKQKVIKFLLSIYCYVRYQRFDSDFFGFFYLKLLGLRLENIGKPFYFFKKNSKTVFVLASGETLSELTDDDWEVISKHDSIGVNMSICCDYPVGIQFWEPIESKEINKLFLSRVMSENFSKTKVIFSSLYAYRNRLLEQINNEEKEYLRSSYGYFPYELTMDNPSESTLNRLYDSFNSDKSLFHHCTQIGAAVDYCYKAGYENVVLVGCDLNGGKYFTEVESVSTKYNHNESYDIYNHHRKLQDKKTGTHYGNKHPTMLKEHAHIRGRLTAPEYFRFIVSKYDNKKFRLMVANSKSSLAEFLPVYEIRNEK